MTTTPVIFRSTHRVKFSELDPYNHLHTAAYSGYYVDHRMDGLRDLIGWDVKALAQLPFMARVRRMEEDFERPALGVRDVR